MKKKETISLFELVQFSISFPYPSFTFVLIQSHSLHAIYPIFPFLFPLILEQGKPSSDRIVHARADQSHLLRRSVTEHVTSVHLVRVPTASRCQPRRSGTGRDACPLPPSPSSHPCILTRQNEAIEPVERSRRIHLLLPPNLALPRNCFCS